MPTFTFKAKDVAGRTVTGSMEAASRKEALAELSRERRVPLDVRQAKGRGKWWEGDVLWGLRRVRKKELLVFTRQMRSLLRAGVPVLSAVRSIGEQTDNPKLRMIVEGLASEVEEGRTLSEAMRSHVKVFGELYVNTVRGGEVSGTLDKVLEQLGDVFEHEVEMQAALKSAVRYPVMVVVAMFCSVAFMMSFVVPRFAALYARFKTRLPFPTRVLIGVSTFVRDNWYFLVAGAICLAIALGHFVRSRKGRRLWHKFLSKLPVLGKLVGEIAISRFSRMMAVLERSGLVITHSLQVAAGAVGNALVEEEVDAVLRSVEEGGGLSPVLERSKVFPPMVGQMVAMGEKSGMLDTAMEEISRHYDSEVRYKVKNLTTLLEPILLALLAGGVLVLMLAIFLPLWDMIKLFKR
jgi:MSHA biogenesis protein MshG